MAELRSAYDRFIAAAINEIVILGENVKTPNGNQARIVIYSAHSWLPGTNIRFVGRACFTELSSKGLYYGYKPLDFKVISNYPEALEAFGRDATEFSDMRYYGPCHFNLRSQTKGEKVTHPPAIKQIAHYRVAELLLLTLQEMRHYTPANADETLVADGMIDRIVAARKAVQDQQTSLARPL